MDHPRVAVCIPSGPLTATATTVSLATLMTRGNVAAILNHQSSNIAEGRNRLVLDAKKARDITHILWVDSDMMFPSDGLSILLSHKLPVVGCFYSTRVPPCRIAGKLADTSKWGSTGLEPAVLMGHGFLLVEMSVYDAMDTSPTSPWYVTWYDESRIRQGNPLGFVAEDDTWSQRVISAGYEVMCDMGLSQKIGHQGAFVAMMQDAGFESDSIDLNNLIEANGEKKWRQH